MRAALRMAAGSGPLSYSECRTDVLDPFSRAAAWRTARREPPRLGLAPFGRPVGATWSPERYDGEEGTLVAREAGAHEDAVPEQGLRLAPPRARLCHGRPTTRTSPPTEELLFSFSVVCLHALMRAFPPTPPL